MSDLDYLFLIVRNFPGNPTTMKIPFSQAEIVHHLKIELQLNKRTGKNFPWGSQLSNQTKIILLFCFFGYTTRNESFEFLLGKCQRAKSHGTMGVGVGVVQQLRKIRSLLLILCFFPLSFPLLFFTILNIDIG